MAAKRKPGRPTKYRPEFCERVVELAKDGRGVAEIALDLDVAIKTLHNWKHEHEEFLHALSRARDVQRAWWDEQARLGLISEKGRSLNAGLWKIVMQAQWPDEFRDRADLNVSGEVKHTLDLAGALGIDAEEDEGGEER